MVTGLQLRSAARDGCEVVFNCVRHPMTSDVKEGFVDRVSAVEAINRLIVERLKLISKARATALTTKFTRDHRAGFQAPDGRMLEGIVLRLNKKTISTTTDDGHRWNVAPGLRGRDIKRYRVNFAGLWLINTHNGYGNVPPIDVTDYPAVKAHLDQYRDRLKRRQDKGFTAYNLRNCAYLEEFAKEKIVWGNLALSCQFALAGRKMYINAPSPLIGGGNRFLLAVLNSTMADFYIRSLGVTRNGGYFEYKPMFVEKLPVPNISDSRRNTVRSLANYVSLTTGNNLKLHSAFFEQLIDGLIYELYFPEDMKGAGKDVFRHLGELPPISDGMTEEKKLAVIQREFDRLYDPNHPVRNIIETLDSVEVVHTIREALRK